MAIKIIVKEDKKTKESTRKKKEITDKLGLVAFVKNTVLYSDKPEINTKTGKEKGHYARVTSIDPETKNVGLSVITSLEDEEGNPTKQEKVEKGLILPIPKEKVKGSKRDFGINLELLTDHKVSGKKINYSELENLGTYSIVIDSSMNKKIYNFHFENEDHKRQSKNNKSKVKNHKILK